MFSYRTLVSIVVFQLATSSIVALGQYLQNETAQPPFTASGADNLLIGCDGSRFGQETGPSCENAADYISTNLQPMVFQPRNPFMHGGKGLPINFMSGCSKPAGIQDYYD